MKLDTSTVTHISGWREYSIAHHAGGSQTVRAYLVKEHQAAFPAFLRIHKQYLVNPDFVETIDKISNNNDVWCRLKTGGVLKVSRHRVRAILLQWQNFQIAQAASQPLNSLPILSLLSHGQAA